MKTILIMMDSLNRHYLSAYGDDRVQTPNLQRLADKGVVFTNHYCGSLPCMPARRDIFTGRLNFLEAPWCPLQPFDEAFPAELRKQKQTYSHMITDHYHYWELNGQGYNLPFNSWEFIRGQEGDPWHAQVADPEVPPYRGKNRRQDWINRKFMNLENEEEYPTPQCFQRGIEFLETNHEQDNWYLHLEVFDPHEPFIAPKKYLDMYNADWDGDYHFDWPSYAPVDMEIEGEMAIAHIRQRYAASLTMDDVWLGKFLDTMDKHDLWQDTTVILTTDHGHLLGEHGYWAKNYMFDYQELAHIPLFIYSPAAKYKGQRVHALTTNIDLMPTIMELHGAKPSEKVQGKSLLHLLDQDGPHHDAVLFGYFGKDINMTDGRYTYTRQPIVGSTVYSHTAMVVGSVDSYYQAELGKYLPYTDVPIYRVAHKSRRHHDAPTKHLLYDIQQDPEQSQPIQNSVLEADYEDKLRELLDRYQAPACQYIRTGLEK